MNCRVVVKSSKTLSRSFFVRKDTVQIAKDLLGQVIRTSIDGKITSGIIVETEAYLAPEDQASHAKNNRRTARTTSFYKMGGTAYVYISYGVHHLFNVVTGPEDYPHAILVRAIEPMEGLDTMYIRRKSQIYNRTLTGGPGRLSVALGIDVRYDGIDLCHPDSPIKIVCRKRIPHQNIVATSRIGIASVGAPWASAALRFCVGDSKWLSR